MCENFLRIRNSEYHLCAGPRKRQSLKKSSLFSSVSPLLLLSAPDSGNCALPPNNTFPPARIDRLKRETKDNDKDNNTFPPVQARNQRFKPETKDNDKDSDKDNEKDKDNNSDKDKDKDNNTFPPSRIDRLKRETKDSGSNVLR